MISLSVVEFLVTVVFFAVVVMALMIYLVVFNSIFRDAPFVPSPRKVAEAMMDLAEVKPGEKVVDLGSGNGEILFAAARRGARAVGYELSLPLCWITRARSLLNQTSKKVEIIRKDFYLADLAEADVVICYLFPKAVANLTSKFEKTLRPGTRVISSTFPFYEWKPKQTIHIANRSVFLYTLGRVKNKI